MTEVLEADNQLMEFMKSQVKERKAKIGSMAPSDRKAGAAETDAFTLLVEANENEEGKFKLNDRELVRCLVIFYFYFLET